MLHHEEDQCKEKQSLDSNANLQFLRDLRYGRLACLGDLGDPNHLDEPYKTVKFSDTSDSRHSVETAHHEYQVEGNH
jgi:hypothetical protein